jgi:integrase
MIEITQKLIHSELRDRDARIAAGETFARKEIRDSIVSGFVLRVSSTSSAFYFYYNFGNKRNLKLKMGEAVSRKFPVAGQKPDDYRTKAFAYKNLVKSGIDPKLELKRVERAEEKERSEGTLRAYIDKYKVWDGNSKNERYSEVHFEYMMNTPIKDFTATDFHDYKNNRLLMKNSSGNNITLSTIDRDLCVIRKVFNHAVDNDVIRVNPANDIVNIRISNALKKKVQPLTDIEIKSLLKDWQLLDDSLPLKFEIIVGIKQGIRLGSLMALKWKYFDLENRLLKIPAIEMKSKKEHVMPLDDQVVEHLIKYRSLRNVESDDELCVPSSKKNRYKKKKNNNSAWYTFRKGSDFSTVNWHQFRHTFGTALAEQGVEIYDIMKLMAHASITSTMVYAKPSRQNAIEAMKKIGDDTRFNLN